MLITLASLFRCFPSSRSHLLNTVVDMLLHQLALIFIQLFCLACCSLNLCLSDGCGFGSCDGHNILNQFDFIFSCGLLLWCLHRKHVCSVDRYHFSGRCCCYFFKLINIVELVTLDRRLITRYQFILLLLLSIESLVVLLLIRSPNLLSDRTLHIHIVGSLCQLHRIALKLPLLVVEWVVCIALKLISPI